MNRDMGVNPAYSLLEGAYWEEPGAQQITHANLPEAIEQLGAFFDKYPTGGERVTKMLLQAAPTDMLLGRVLGAVCMQLAVIRSSEKEIASMPQIYRILCQHAKKNDTAYNVVSATAADRIATLRAPVSNGVTRVFIEETEDRRSLQEQWVEMGIKLLPNLERYNSLSAVKELEFLASKCGDDAVLVCQCLNTGAPILERAEYSGEMRRAFDKVKLAVIMSGTMSAFADECTARFLRNPHTLHQQRFATHVLPGVLSIKLLPEDKKRECIQAGLSILPLLAVRFPVETREATLAIGTAARGDHALVGKVLSKIREIMPVLFSPGSYSPGQSEEFTRRLSINLTGRPYDQPRPPLA